jgi:hypothetical protein
MSADKISIAILEDFIKKTRVALKTNQKEIKISAQEADQLIFNLNLILLRLFEKAELTEKPQDSQVITIAMDGGSFNEKR